MSAFSDAVDDLFADPNLAITVLYQPVVGEVRSVRALVRRPDQDVQFGDISVHASTALFEIRVGEVSNPQAGDSITLGNEVFLIQGEPSRDAEQLIWRIDTRPGR